MKTRIIFFSPPHLFNLYSERILREVEELIPGFINTGHNFKNDTGLTINCKKENRILSCQQKRCEVQTGDVKIEQVQKLNYLDSVVSKKIKHELAIQRHIRLAVDAFQKQRKVLRH